MSIYDFLRGYSADRFHTPGHKGRLDTLDITEIEGEFPEDIVSAAERKTARLYAAKNLRYLTGGSSIGMKAALLAAGGGVVSEAYRHRCVDEGAALGGNWVYTIPETETICADGLPALPDAESVVRALNRSGADCAVIQYPDYYGRCADLESIYAAVKRLGKTLIADSAHGAHFAFRPDLFPKSAAVLSDACNMSAHKTLNAYTQTAYLAYSDDMKARGIEDKLDLLGTTSPNYVLLAQLEKAADDAVDCADNYDIIKLEAEDIKRRVRTLDNDDFTRLVVDCRGAGGGREVFNQLRIAGITAEKFDDNYIIFILTPDDDTEKIRRLAHKLESIRGLKIEG